MTKNSDIQVGNKSTELGVKPEEWNISKLESVAQIIMGQSPPGTTYNEIGEGKPFLQGKAEFREVNPKNIKYTTDPKKIAPIGSILMSVRAPVGDVNIADIEYCIGRGLAAISLKTGDNQFLFFLLQHLKDEIEKEGTGSIFKSINKAKLLEFEIPLPLLPEQHAIATTLRTVQEAKEKTDAVIAATKALKAATMKHLFTYGPVPPEDTKKVTLRGTEIGQMPEEWEVVRVDDVCEKISVGIVVRPASHYVESGIPALRSLNIKEDRISLNDLVYFSQQKNDTILSKSKLKGGDVVIVRTGYPGTACIISKELDGINCIDLVFARPKYDKIKSEFLSRFFNSEMGKSQTLASKTGLAQQHLNVNAVKNTKIPLPPLIIQGKIIEILSTIDKKLAAEQSRKEALDTLFASLLHDLMTAKIRVKNIA